MNENTQGGFIPTRPMVACDAIQADLLHAMQCLQRFDGCGTANAIAALERVQAAINEAMGPDDPCDTLGVMPCIYS